MALKSEERKEVYLKLIYCGPDDSVKADNLHYIHKKLNPVQRGEIINLDPEGIQFFDFRPPNIPQIDGCNTVFHLYLCPESGENISAVKHVLRGADGIIFVADSDPASVEKNLESMKKLGANLSHLKISIDAVPLVLQYNRRDSQAADDVEGLQMSLNVFDAPFVKAESAEGKGILETFTQISKLVIKSNQEGSNLSTAGIAEEDELHLELMRVRNGQERLGFAAEPQEAVVEEKTPLAASVFEEAEENVKKEVSSEDSMEQYTISVDDLSAEEEEQGITEEIEMEPGFEFGGEETFDEEPEGIELEVREEPTDGEFSEIEDISIPEGIEMEPGFELEDEEMFGTELIEGEEELAGGDFEEIEDMQITEEINMESGLAGESTEVGETLTEAPFPPETGESETVISGEMAFEPIADISEAVEEPGKKEDMEIEHAFTENPEEADDLDMPDDLGREPDLGLNNGERLRPLQDEPHGLGEKEVEEAGQVDIPEYSAMKSAIKAAGEETAAPAFMQTPIEAGDEVTPPKRYQDKKAGEISEPLVTEVLDEIKASIGKPLSQGGGLFSIPLVLGSGKEEKTFNLKISIILEELQSVRESSPKIVEKEEQRIKKVKTPLAQVETIEDASFLDEVEDKSVASKSRPSKIKLDTPPVGKNKKGFFAALFSRKK